LAKSLYTKKKKCTFGQCQIESEITFLSFLEQLLDMSADLMNFTI